jgi:hypothetical protein
MKELLGRKILKIFINSEKTELAFHCEGNVQVHVVAKGDCCSYSWFEHLSGVEALINGLVREIEEVDLSSLSIEGKDALDEWIEFYGYKFKTDLGYSDLEFRNSSNGYYGGYLVTQAYQISNDFQWDLSCWDEVTESF